MLAGNCLFTVTWTLVETSASARSAWRACSRSSSSWHCARFRPLSSAPSACMHFRDILKMGKGCSMFRACMTLLQSVPKWYGIMPAGWAGPAGMRASALPALRLHTPCGPACSHSTVSHSSQWQPLLIAMLLPGNDEMSRQRRTMPGGAKAPASACAACHEGGRGAAFGLGMSVLVKLSSGVAWAGATGALNAGPPQPAVLTPV